MAASTTCQNCGASASQGATFCPSCGEMLLDLPAPSAPAGPDATSTTPVPEPQVVQVPRRPAPQRPSPGRTRSQVPPTQPPRTGRAQGPLTPPPQTQQFPPQSGTFGAPQGRPVRSRRRRGGCGTLLFRLLALVIGLPILFSLASRFLLGSGQEGATSQTRPASTQTPLTFNTPSSPPTAATPLPSLTPPAGTAPSSAPATAYPDLVLTGEECRRTGNGPHAAVAAGNDTTTCAFALSTQDAYLRADPEADRSVQVTAWSQARGRNITVRCTGDQPVRCESSTGALVYLYGGKASFR